MHKTTSPRTLLLLAGLTFAAAGASAADTVAISFSHHDWELACDNTRTCRAAGYQSDDAELPVSVLLTRKAGAGEAVSGQLRIDLGRDEARLPAQLNLAMTVNGQGQGTVVVPKDQLRADLSPAQVSALLASLTRQSRIEWSTGELRWTLSDQGAAAVLLKMDDFQKRVGTQGALVRKGAAGEERVLPPLPAPVLQLGALAKARPDDARLARKPPAELLDALRDSLDGEQQAECNLLIETRDAEVALAVHRLTRSKLLVSSPCWLAAYNSGDGMWVVNDKPPYQPVLVTTAGTDFSAGVIGSVQKGRGIGDCWGHEEWAWDGRRFVQTLRSSSGLCKGFPGGAWDLPTRVMELRR
ncbi:DUF1176 domain-containing protein [uncultured Azohydromonas sp.]|jgi:Protein of unknown function (DUF1176).|uniref:DUF1176 domain-containing protein n=1 Tax=uncultured Azohydromonas sp. TaxID=487342 RepID=UPI0026348F41|nr:DUF1176 domain-containing protein [uncultured Azohydromonas sp.]